MSVTIVSSCKCGGKVVSNRGERGEHRKCECPWPEIAGTAPPEIRSTDGFGGVWREADDLVIMWLPTLGEFRISNEGAEKLYYDLARVVGIRAPQLPNGGSERSQEAK